MTALVLRKTLMNAKAWPEMHRKIQICISEEKMAISV